MALYMRAFWPYYSLVWPYWSMFVPETTMSWYEVPPLRVPPFGASILALAMAQNHGAMEAAPMMLCALLSAMNLGAKQVRAELCADGEITIPAGKEE